MLVESHEVVDESQGVVPFTALMCPADKVEMPLTLLRRKLALKRVLVLGRQIREGCLLSPQDKGIGTVEVELLLKLRENGWAVCNRWLPDRGFVFLREFGSTPEEMPRLEKVEEIPDIK